MRVNVLGVGFDNVTMAEAVEEAVRLLEGPEARYVVTPNPERMTPPGGLSTARPWCCRTA